MNKTYRGLEIIEHATNGWYAYGQLPASLASVDFVNHTTDTLVKSIDSGVKSAIEVDRVLAVTSKFITVSMTVDLTQLWGLPPQPDRDRSLGRVVMSLDIGKPEDELTSWITDDSVEIFQNMLTCQRSLERLYAEGNLIVDGEAIEPYFDMNSNVSRFRGISRAQAYSLGLTPEEYPYSGTIRFSLVNGGYGFASIAVAFNPKSGRHLYTIIGSEGGPEDTYTGKIGCVFAGLRAIGASTKARTSAGNITSYAKPSKPDTEKVQDAKVDTSKVPF